MGNALSSQCHRGYSPTNYMQYLTWYGFIEGRKGHLKEKKWSAKLPNCADHVYLYNAWLQLLHRYLLLGLHCGTHHLPLHHTVLLQGSLVLMQHSLLMAFTQVLREATLRLTDPLYVAVYHIAFCGQQDWPLFTWFTNSLCMIAVDPKTDWVFPPHHPLLFSSKGNKGTVLQKKLS